MRERGIATLWKLKEASFTPLKLNLSLHLGLKMSICVDYCLFGAFNSLIEMIFCYPFILTTK